MCVLKSWASCGAEELLQAVDVALQSCRGGSVEAQPPWPLPVVVPV